MEKIKKVAILGGVRIPFCRSGTNYALVDNRELMTASLKHLVSRFKLQERTLGGVCVGAVVKSSRDFSLARECSIDAGLSFETPAFDLQMACGTGLEAAIFLAQKIALGQIDSAIAGGCDSTSVVPIELGGKLSSKLLKVLKEKNLLKKLQGLAQIKLVDIKPSLLAIKEPRTGLSMGEHCELMAKEWKISRLEQDQLALQSHHNASMAYHQGFYQDLVCPFNGVEMDNNIRSNSSIEKLSKLPPAFDTKNGTITAGNSSPTTDGSSAVLLSSEEFALSQGFEIQAYLTISMESAVDYKNKEGLLMAPAYAIPKMLERANLNLEDFDFYEIHEAFAAQVLCTLKAFNDSKFCRERLRLNKTLGSIDLEKLNVKGGSLAIGHPFAATGARILANLAKLLHQNKKGRGLISICTAGGMGVTAILERP